MPRTQGRLAVRGHAQDDSAQGETQSRNDSGGNGAAVKSSHVIEEHIDVGVPREVAFDQWTSYQDLAKYAKHESAEQKRPDRVSFQSKIGPSSRGWDAQIVEQRPGRRIVWRSIGGAQHMGVMTFHKIDDRLTRVMVEMEYHPSGFFETVGNFFRMQRRRVRKDLRLFKHFVELRGEATGKGSRDRLRGEGLRQEVDDRLGTTDRTEGTEPTSDGRADRARPKGARKAS
jgi:uncharacterized membrane protein